MSSRRFPALVRRGIGRCFVVPDNGGQKISYVYFEEEPGGDRRLSYSFRAGLRLLANSRCRRSVWP